MMNNNILLSIIVPVYNVEQYLRRCLDSIVPQLCGEIEVLIIDDCSPDGSSLIYQEYERLYPQIRSIKRKKNGKISMARNTGIAHAKGQYCWFIDSDDKIDDNAVSNILKDIKTQEVDTLFYSFSKIDSDIEKEYIQIPRQILLTNQITTRNFNNEVVSCKYGFEIWNKIFSTNIIKKYKIEFPKDISYGEDIAFIILYLQYAKAIKISDYRIYFYIIREDSMMGKSKAISHLVDMYHNSKYIFEHISCKQNFYIVFCKFMQEGFIQSWNIDLYDNLKKISGESFLKKMTKECLHHPLSMFKVCKRQTFKVDIFLIMIEAVIYQKRNVFMKLKMLANIH